MGPSGSPWQTSVAVEVEQSWLPVQKAAHLVDVAGNEMGSQRARRVTGCEAEVRECSLDSYRH